MKSAQPRSNGDRPQPELHDLTQIVKCRLEALQLSVTAAEKSGNLPQDAIRNLLRGRRPTFNRLPQICDTLGLEVMIRPRAKRTPTASRRTATPPMESSRTPRGGPSAGA